MRCGISVIGLNEVTIMICRRLKLENNTHHLVWFGSYGKNTDGTAKFYNSNNKHDNYGEKQQAVADSLIQRLSIIERELWYAVEYGLPLLEKLTKKAEVDIEILDIVNSHPDVREVLEFDSSINGREYKAQIKVLSTYGTVNLEI